MTPRTEGRRTATTRAQPLAAGPRERLLSAAGTLFYKRGIRNVGIDEVIAEAGVAKASLYKHFASKDDLVAEYLRRLDTDWRTWLSATVNEQATSPRDRLLVVFDVIGKWLSDAEFRGCAFQNACVEVADVAHPVYVEAGRHKQAMRTYVGELAREAGVRSPANLADQLALLIEGAIMTAHLGGGGQSTAATARTAAAVLLAAAEQNR